MGRAHLGVVNFVTYFWVYLHTSLNVLVFSMEFTMMQT